jgi:hypothetical protein
MRVKRPSQANLKKNLQVGKNALKRVDLRKRNIGITFIFNTYARKVPSAFVLIVQW